MPDHHFQFAIGSEKTRELAAAIGEAPQSLGTEAPPTYAMALIGSKLFALVSSLEIDFATDTVLHTSQRFDYKRQLRIGEIVDCRLSMTELRDQLHGRSMEVICEFTAADGNSILTATTGVLIIRNSEKGQQ